MWAGFCVGVRHNGRRKPPNKNPTAAKVLGSLPGMISKKVWPREAKRVGEGMKKGEGDAEGFTIDAGGVGVGDGLGVTDGEGFGVGEGEETDVWAAGGTSGPKWGKRPERRRTKKSAVITIPAIL